MIYALIYLYSATFLLVHSLKIHTFLTDDEVMGLFHTTRDTLPDYDLVPVLYSANVKDNNGIVNVRVKLFDQNINLCLNRTEGYLASEDTPLWFVKSHKEAPEGLQYTYIPKALENIGIIMQDEKSVSALLVSLQKDERPTFDGFLLSDLVIRSLPKRIIESAISRGHRMIRPHSFDDLMEDNLLNTYYHIVYKQISPKLDKDFKISNPPFRMYPIPDVIYPEILVVVDYSLYSKLGENLEQATRYIVAFWNGVDLRYRSLLNPKIRLNIAGIIIATDAAAIPYINKNRLDSKLVNADRALADMGDYFYQETRFPWKFYDIAMAATHLDLCNMIGNNEICDTATLGYAYVAGACNRNGATKSSQDVGLVEDNGGFAGVLPVAHELGHLIGAHHDGNPKNPGNCSENDDYLMAATFTYTKKKFKWSNCSINAFHQFLSEDKAKCLYDEPPKATAVRRLLPGKVMTLDEQCEQHYGGGSCNTNLSSICYELNCKAGTMCTVEPPAADGTSCGTNYICLDGSCVFEGTEIKQELTSSI